MVSGLPYELTGPGVKDLFAQEEANTPLGDKGELILAAVHMKRCGTLSRSYQVFDNRGPCNREVKTFGSSPCCSTGCGTVETCTIGAADCVTARQRAAMLNARPLSIPKPGIGG